MRLTRLPLLASLLVTAAVLSPLADGAVPYATRWVVMLSEPSMLVQHPGRIEKTRAVAEPYRQHLQQVQSAMRSQIEGMGAHVTGSVQRVLNAIFVVATPAQAEALRRLPGVKAVAPIRPSHKEDQLSLSNVAAAWSAAGIGGASKAGAGIKIGIIDTGIDQTNPSFQDSSLTVPSGYPICDVQANCAFTNNKVIVARSYVPSIESYYTGLNPTDPSLQSRPDDESARDLDGHGTAVASVAAGIQTTSNGNAISGVAPKAFLGNYKIYGSSDVNPNGSGDFITALDDAIGDGMDVINYSSGYSPYSGPLDTNCGGTCDPQAVAVDTAVQSGGVVIVCSAGNEGNSGYQYNVVSASNPTYATVAGPGYAPNAIAAGGVQNDITYVESVQVPGGPSNLQQIVAVTSADGPEPASPFSAPAIDITQAGDSDGLLCSPITNSVANDIVLVLRGSCNFSVKLSYAQNAGAVGVIVIDNGTGLAPWSVGSSAAIYGFLVGASDGQNLKSYIDAHPGTKVTLNPNPFPGPASIQAVDSKCSPGESNVPSLTNALIPDSVACFASLGPVTGAGSSVKPDVSAAATDFLLAAESYDPNGELFSLSGYSSADGTSFSSPMIAGAAALVKQANPAFTPLEIKSALVNTGVLTGIMTSDGTAAATPASVGSGLLQANSAVASVLEAQPSSVSFGALAAGVPTSQQLTLLNTGSSSLTVNLSISGSGTELQLNNASTASVTVPAGQGENVTVSLGGVPAAGRYEGLINGTAGSTTIHIPYTYIVSDNTPYDIIPLNSTPPGFVGFEAPVSSTIPWTSSVTCATPNSCELDYGPIAIKVVDRFGVPVANAAVTWAVTQGDGSVLQGSQYTDSATDANGIAGASVTVASTPGYVEYTATVGGLTLPIDGYAQPIPAINTGGIVDAASFGAAVAPGSWIAVYGANLSDTLSGNSGVDEGFDFCGGCSPVYQPFPMGLDGAAMSFDTASVSVPGRFYYVSPTQVNVQVPWELEGASSATVKVMVNYAYSNLITLPLTNYAPGFFQASYSTHAAAAELPNYSLVTASNPVATGGTVLLYLNGLGPVNNPPADGFAAANANSTTTTTPVITIGGQTANVTFSGLSPGSAGLYQVNAVVPAGVASGLQPIVCKIGGATSATAYLYIK